MKSSPMIEALSKIGANVLLLVDPTEEDFLMKLGTHAGKAIKSIEKGEIELLKESKARLEVLKPEFSILTKWIQKTYGDKYGFKFVKLSSRLKDKPAIITVPDNSYGSVMRRAIKTSGQYDPSIIKMMEEMKTLELNPDHLVIQKVLIIAKKAKFCKDTVKDLTSYEEDVDVEKEIEVDSDELDESGNPKKIKEKVIESQKVTKYRLSLQENMSQDLVDVWKAEKDPTLILYYNYYNNAMKALQDIFNIFIPVAILASGFDLNTLDKVQDSLTSFLAISLNIPVSNSYFSEYPTDKEAVEKIRNTYEKISMDDLADFDFNKINFDDIDKDDIFNKLNPEQVDMNRITEHDAFHGQASFVEKENVIRESAGEAKITDDMIL